jgi:hypothetical protein
MDPWILFRLPALGIRLFVGRFGWKLLLALWVLNLPVIYLLMKVI